MKQHFMQDKAGGGGESLCYYTNLNNLSPTTNESISFQLQFQYILVFLIGTFLPVGNILRKR